MCRHPTRRVLKGGWRGRWAHLFTCTQPQQRATLTSDPAMTSSAFLRCFHSKYLLPLQRSLWAEAPRRPRTAGALQTFSSGMWKACTWARAGVLTDPVALTEEPNYLHLLPRLVSVHRRRLNPAAQDRGEASVFIHCREYYGLSDLPG